MQYGLTLPNVGACGDAQTLTMLAQEAEAAGWDGIFVWDCVHVAYDDPALRPMCDPWIALATMATRTERVRLGTMVTPLARRRPWKLARETVTLDRLSHGRLILPVGLGSLHDGGFSRVGEDTDRKIRAQRLDEGLDILTGLWSGQPFSYKGQHYHVREMAFLPPPMQSPRIPIWVVGAWPRPKSMHRALRYDGVLPAKMHDDGTFSAMTRADLQAMKAFIAEQRAQTTPFDIVMEGETPGDDREQAIAKIRPLAEAGLTRWLENVYDNLWSDRGMEGMRTRITQGPPRIV
jgi:alkanesulfonate monooxygenase SsuD/methylene tetrahydromethanopterin reductase-like flavin-dependent oxidoreductase (luciferase family)